MEDTKWRATTRVLPACRDSRRLSPLSPLQAFDLVPDREAGSSSLVIGGKPVPVRFPGVSLTAQFQCGEGYLLLTTADSPFEESLYAILLGMPTEILDVVELSNPYTPAALTDLEIVSDNSLEFSFFGRDRWRLSVSERPQWRFSLPIFSPVKRKTGFSRRYLRLHAV
ncbi:MAG: hypothetical protein JOY64_10075 [Alphaproteobacteria bacterium]|nr:hypothetical protein [Alphaproteobacteria bacterium]